MTEKELGEQNSNVIREFVYALYEIYLMAKSHANNRNEPELKRKHQDQSSIVQDELASIARLLAEEVIEQYSASDLSCLLIAVILNLKTSRGFIKRKKTAAIDEPALLHTKKSADTMKKLEAGISNYACAYFEGSDLIYLWLSQSCCQISKLLDLSLSHLQAISGKYPESTIEVYIERFDKSYNAFSLLIQCPYKQHIDIASVANEYLNLKADIEHFLQVSLEQLSSYDTYMVTSRKELFKFSYFLVGLVKILSILISQKIPKDIDEPLLATISSVEEQ